MNMDKQHRILWLVLALLMLAVIAAYLFFPHGDLQELKQTEEVAEGAEEAAACVREIIAAAQAKVREAGLPERLAERLAFGQ